MSHKSLGLISCALMVFLNFIGWKYLMNLGIFQIILYDIFLVVCYFLANIALREDLRECFLPVFALMYWSIHYSLSIFRLGYLDSFSESEIDWCLGILIIATILLYLGISFGNRILTKPMSLSYYRHIPDGVYYVLLIIYFLYIAARFYFAGGIVNYLYSDYQFKMPESVSTLFFILKKIFAGFDYFNLLFVTGDRGKRITIISRCFFVFSIFNVFANGGSSGILYLLIALICVLIFKSKDMRQINKYIKRAVPVAIIGVYAGILIRFNRTDYANFSFNVLDNAMDSILGSATFDCLENLIRVVRDFSPTYTLGQLIYPIVNWLPRSIFSWKPTELGTIVASTYHNFESGANAGFATSPMADFYYDMGYIGMFSGMLFLGSIIGYMQRKFYDGNLNSDITIWAFVFSMSLMSVVPNWYTGFGLRLFYMFIFYLLVKFVCMFFDCREVQEDLEDITEIVD